ncbi:hypothetical protein RUM43_008995 [Polyplax serrata]|uniref:Uncharacterized protein n=1 Tax=Polyplax serrata TaxID=468196 RepID=A0AAN8PA46_POLSC
MTRGPIPYTFLISGLERSCGLELGGCVEPHHTSSGCVTASCHYDTALYSRGEEDYITQQPTVCHRVQSDDEVKVIRIEQFE